MALTIGELVGYLDLDDTGWGRKNKQAHDDMRRMRDDIDSTAGTTNKMAAGFLKAANNLSNIPTAAQGIAGTVSILANMSGALGLIPAAGAGAVAAIATLKLGVQGFGDAMKNAGDPKKFAESLETLAPSARESAVALRDLRDEWEQMQNSIQQKLFEGLADDIRKLGGTYIPVLQKGVSGIAAEFNTGAQNTAGFLAQARQVESVSAIFGGTKTVVGELSQALQPLTSILLDLVAVGMELLPGLAGGFGDAATRAAEFVRKARETGDLREWISKGLSTIGDLAKLFGQLGQIAGTVFSGLNAGGANMLDWMLKVTAQVRDFLKSFEGQQALKALGQALNTVSSVVTQVLLTAFRELAPVIVQLAPGFAELARQVGAILVDALRIAGPLLQLLAGFLSENISWLGPLAIALYTGVQAFQAITAAVRIFNAVSNQNPWLVIIAATIALVMLIITHWDQIKAAVAAAWDWIKQRAADVWAAIKVMIINPITDAARWVGNRIRDILNFFEWLGSLPGKVRDWFRSVKDGAVQMLVDLVNWVRGLPGRIVEAVGNLGRLLWDAGRQVIQGLLDGIASMAQEVANVVGDIGSTIADGFSAVMGIFSPSRVMADLGRMIPLGVAAGIDAGMPALDKAIRDMAGRSMIGMDSPDLGRPSGPAPFANGSEQRALVHIDNYHPPADAPPEKVAADLDWASRGGGY